MQEDTHLTEASIQAQLQERARQAVDRQQQTGEAHRQGFLSGTATPIIERIFSMTTPKTPTTPVPLQMPSPQRPLPSLPQRQHPQPISIASDVEEISSGEMQTATEKEQTEEPKSAVLRTITYRTNIATLSEEALKFQLFLRGIDVDSPEIKLETRKKGKGPGKTTKQYYLDLAMDMVDDGRWETRVNAELLAKRISDYRKAQGKGRVEAKPVGAKIDNTD